MSAESIFREWNTLWNDKPLVSDADAVEPRVASVDHVFRGLEGERKGCVSKDQMSCSELTVSFVYIHFGL